MGKYEEKKKRSPIAVILVILVVICCCVVISTVALAGIIFLWAGTFEDSGGDEVDILNLDVSASYYNYEISIEVISGTVVWGQYNVVANDYEVTTSSVTSYAGNTATFIGAWFDMGDEVEVEITRVSDHRLVFSVSVIAGP